MFDVMGWPYLCLYNNVYKQVENPFVESIQSLQQAGDSPLAAKEIGHLPVRSVPSFPILAHLVQDKPQVLREVRAPLVVELQVSLAR